MGVREESKDGMCLSCKKACQAINCVSNPEASEFYCHGCHKSHRMPKAVYTDLNAREKATQRG